MLTKQLTRGGDPDLLPGPVEQFDPEFFLQLAHRCGEGGLDDMCAVCGAREFISLATAMKYSSCRSSIFQVYLSQ